MAHHHHHEHGHEHHRGEIGHVHPITKNLTVAFALNLCFTIIEFIGGLLTNSMAILSDAIHDLGDTLAIGSALYFEKRSQKGRDHRFSYGYRRFSTLAALLNIVILTTGSIVIIIETIPRLVKPEPVHTTGMMGLAVLGVFMNGLAVLRLRKGGNSLNNQTVMLHLMEDALGWVAVLVGSILLYYTNWYIIDPILSLGIAGFILYNAIKNFNKVWQVFMQAVPKQINYDHLKDHVQSVENVKEVHDIHIWSLDGEFNVASLHLVLKNDLSTYNIESVKKEVRKVFSQEGVKHVTIELEGPEENCEMENCVE
jgi:cobalt-zinc-cadmium efflux system protein